MQANWGSELQEGIPAVIDMHLSSRGSLSAEGEMESRHES